MNSFVSLFAFYYTRRLYGNMQVRGKKFSNENNRINYFKIIEPIENKEERQKKKESEREREKRKYD